MFIKAFTIVIEIQIIAAGWVIPVHCYKSLLQLSLQFCFFRIAICPFAMFLCLDVLDIFVMQQYIIIKITMEWLVSCISFQYRLLFPVVAGFRDPQFFEYTFCNVKSHTLMIHHQIISSPISNCCLFYYFSICIFQTDISFIGLNETFSFFFIYWKQTRLLRPFFV